MDSSTRPEIDTASAPAPPTREERVAVITGNRFCAQCGYSLTGQAVFRERHYEMLIARCPECGTVASVQEYPLLARWAGRWAMVLAAFWLLFLVALLFGGTAGTAGMAIGTGETASNSYRTWIEERFTADILAEDATAVPNSWSPAFATWWNKQDQEALLEEFGGVFATVNWSVYGLWVPSSALPFVFSCLWAVILCHWTRPRLLIWGGVIALVTGAWAVLIVEVATGRNPWGTANSYGVASEAITPTLAYLTVGITTIPTLAGLLIGRPLARFVVRFLLPPTMQSTLAALWTADGLPPPRPVTNRHG